MDGNVVNNRTAQRVACITTTKNIQSEEQNKDQLCAMKINDLVKLVNDKVQGKQSSKTASVKQEDSLIRQIFSTALSADTKDPINLGILAPTSEGKTYPVIESLQYFPKSKIWYIGKMSPMVLVIQKGIIVDTNNESIEPLINDLKSIIKDKNTEESIRESKKEELLKLYAESKNLIDLDGIVLVFLEPPHMIYGI